MLRSIRINVPDDVEDDSGTVTFRLSRSDIGPRDPNAVRLALLERNGWTVLETQVIDRNPDSVLFRTAVPHFSDFSIIFVSSPGTPTNRSTPSATSTPVVTASGGRTPVTATSNQETVTEGSANASLPGSTDELETVAGRSPGKPVEASDSAGGELNPILIFGAIIGVILVLIAGYFAAGFVIDSQ